MKIMSYIQKIFAVLFLSLLAVSCTDEMIAHGGSTTPIEEGKLVDVKFMLDQAGTKTVVTRSGDDNDPANPVVNDLLFLQYKDDGSGYQLVHTWYTKVNVKNFGGSSTVNVQLLSGTDYIVYVLSNIEKYNQYNQLVGESDLKEDSSLPSSSKVYTSFATPDDVKKVKLEPPLTVEPFGEEVMMAVATTIDQADNNNEEFKSTLMPTYLSPSSNQFVNYVTDAFETVDIAENKNLYATFYVPYAQVSFKIETNLKENIQIDLEYIRIENSVKGYSLANGFSLNELKESYWYGQKYPTVIYGNLEEGKNVEGSNVTLSGQNGYTAEKTYWIYENMAGVLDKTYQTEKVPQTGEEGSYTYFEVKGKYKTTNSSKDITYRFILGKDNFANCNVERNVHYKVTMKLQGDGGIGEDSWRVEYEGEPGGENPEPPVTITPNSGLGKLDAHASLCKLSLTFSKKGHYYILPWMGEGEPTSFVSDKSKDDFSNKMGVIFDNKLKGKKQSKQEIENISIDWANTTSNLGRGYFEIEEKHLNQPYELSFIQKSWFDYKAEGQAYHESTQPGSVAQADIHSYKLYIVYREDAIKADNPTLGADDLIIEPIEVSQYPPLVLAKIDRNGNAVADNNKTYYYIERFYDGRNSDDDDKETDDLYRDLFGSKDDLSGQLFDDWDDLDEDEDGDDRDELVAKHFKAATDRYSSKEKAESPFYVLNGADLWENPNNSYKSLPADSYYDSNNNAYKPRHFWDKKDKVDD